MRVGNGITQGWLISLSLFAFAGGPLFAGPPSDMLLPQTTKGYISVARPGEFKQRWLETQMGQMLNDEVMQPFVEDLREQLQDEYHAVEDKLGIAWDDLEGVPGGEMSLSLIEREGDEAAMAITIDVTDRDREAAGLLAAIEARFAERGGRKQTAERGGTTFHIFTVPIEASGPPQVTVYFIEENVLCGVDDLALAEAMLRRFGERSRDSLASFDVYLAVMKRCAEAADRLEPEARWFVEPFGFIHAARSLQEENGRRNGEDFVKILEENGFDAIRGAGGFLNQLVVEGEIDFVHRTCIYAPPVIEGDPLRWAKSMRMMQLPNAEAFEPQSWVPRMTASYTTFMLDPIAAFDNIGPLFDAIQEHEDAWINTLEGWKSDPYGPKVDVRKEIVAHLGQRITLIRGYNVPISPESERSLFAVEAKNEKQLAQALEKWMTREPDVVRRELGPYIVWERVPRRHVVEEPLVEVPGFTLEETDDKAEKDETERERVLPSSAVTVALGHLMMASDINYLAEILEGFGQRERLGSSPDYQQVVAVLNEVAPGPRSGLSFGRSDEEFRPLFELIRQGRMPESKTMLGKFLNNVLTTERERQQGILRKQQIEGEKLPNFEAVRRYFGPHGGIIRSEPDGWFITGVVLNKEAP